MGDALIHVEQLVKTFDVPVRDAGLKASVRSLVKRTTREVRAVDGISFDVAAGEEVGAGVEIGVIAHRHLGR